MPIREIKNPHLKLPVKVKTKRELEPVIELFEAQASNSIIKQLHEKKTFHEKVKFLRFMGYVE